MSDRQKRYWKGLEELSNDLDFVKSSEKEFPEYLPVKDAYGDNTTTNSEVNGGRRDFLKLMGFGIAAVSLAACETPVQKAIPYLNKPEDVDPGIANWYASTYMDGSDYCSILVRTREGRPVKIEGNTLSSVTMGGLTTRAQASVLNLYDQERYKGPSIKGKNTSWEEVDNKVIQKLQSVVSKGLSIKIISPSIFSPSTKRAIADFKAKYPMAEHVMYDADSSYGMLEANRAMFGTFALPSYDFSKADTIVSFSADFLSTWGGASEGYARQYALGRKLGKSKKQMSKHYQFESLLSLTGANADIRKIVTPAEEITCIVALYNLIAKASGQSTLKQVGTTVPHEATLKEIAQALIKNKGQSLVMSGSNDSSVQMVINKINSLVGSYGSTIDPRILTYTKQGDDKLFNAFVDDLKAGKVGAVIFYGANPIYDHPRSKEIKEGLKKVELSVSLADRPDETAVAVEFICPDHYYLEAWNDAEPKKGYFSLCQPSITPIFKTRQAQESLLKWAGIEKSFYDYMREYWTASMYSSQNKYLTAQDFWDHTLQDGVFELSASTSSESIAPTFDSARAESGISKTYNALNKGLSLQIYQKPSVGTGRQANNPWLQELPNPITRACWGNYVTVSKRMASEKGWNEGDVVVIENGKGAKLELPVVIQPGQANGTLGVAMGYGREVAGKAAKGVGKSVYPFIEFSGEALTYAIGSVSISRGSGFVEIARTQTHHTLMGRPIIQETTLSEYKKNPKSGRYFPKIQTAQGPKKPEQVSLWNQENKDFNHQEEYVNHHWGMVIDLNSCIGCGACVVGCQSENNVPVVGKDEVIRSREMHWLRIDRYYSSEKDAHSLKELEEAADEPEVVFQPMLCQHCNHAPCETVCPVAATTHSTEGLNQMAYNRCVGTRYCANNCPYKVRRFNWFRYYRNERFADVNVAMNSDLGRMVLNPDVTVRARGVMEKCTFCVQRIQLGKLNAKKERRRTVDGEIVTACAQSCPTKAITFGDMNDPKSEVSKLLKEENADRAYTVLEEINTQPNVFYLTKVRNKA